jgi:hypothetical protein
MCDGLFSAVTLERTQDNDILSMIFIGNQFEYSKIERLMKQFISSRHYHRHPLFPITLLANSALEDYQELLKLVSFELTSKDGIVEFTDHFGMPVQNHEDPAAGLADIANSREQVTSFRGEFNAFHASVRNVLTLHDGKDASSRDLSSLQSLSTQAGGQAIPIPPLSSTLQYIVSAMGNILEQLAVNEAKLQFTFLVVSIGMNRVSARVVLIPLRCKSASRKETLKWAFDSHVLLPTLPWPRKETRRP